MDWSTLKPVAGKLAQVGLPYLGQILGDIAPFPGGSLIGRTVGDWAGNAIANALGVPATPEHVGAAIEQLPPGELQARLAPVESEAAAKWEAYAREAEANAADRTAQGQAINETVRAEVAHGVSWWHWRHLLGYILVLLGLEICMMIPLVVWGKITAADMASIITAMTPITLTFAGLLGYIAQDTTKKVTTAITGEQPGTVTAAVVRAVTGRKK